jgi:sulfur dioxygenase
MIFRQLFDHVSSTYTYLIASDHGREAVIIDPVLENVNRYIKLLEELDLKLVKVIDTHIHADHISGMAELRDKTNCITVMGDATPADVVSMTVSDNEDIKVDGITIKALHTPGHTSESFSYLMNDRIFSGDTLLIRGSGRTDFQNGSPYDAYESIFGRLLKLPEHTLLYPGHDYKGDTVSTIGEEKRYNPRLQVKSAKEYADIMNNLKLPDPKMMDIAVPGNLSLGINYDRQKLANGLKSDQFQQAIIDPEAVIIDLREPSEIQKEGKIPNSIQVSFSNISSYLSEHKKLLQNKKTLLYCAVGHRSTLAVQISNSYGYKYVHHLIGGIKTWKKDGLPLETTSHH